MDLLDASEVVPVLEVDPQVDPRAVSKRIWWSSERSLGSIKTSRKYYYGVLVHICAIFYLILQNGIFLLFFKSCSATVEIQRNMLARDCEKYFLTIKWIYWVQNGQNYIFLLQKFSVKLDLH